MLIRYLVKNHSIVDHTIFLLLLKNRQDTEMTRNKETTYRLQNDLDHLKSQENLQKQTSRRELDSLKEQRAKLERDKQILRTKIYSLENDKIGLEERYLSKYIVNNNIGSAMYQLCFLELHRQETTSVTYINCSGIPPVTQTSLKYVIQKCMQLSSLIIRPLWDLCWDCFAGLGWTGLGWVGLDCVWLGCVELDWAGLGFVGMGWVGLGFAGYWCLSSLSDFIRLYCDYQI